MARELFLDTSGFFALLVVKDPKHVLAERILRRAQAEKRRLITTDHVLDETATSLKVRGAANLVEPLFERVFQSQACRIEWTNEARFGKVRTFFRRHADKDWSFTDCLSFCVMKEFGLREALTADSHFDQAGFVALLK